MNIKISRTLLSIAVSLTMGLLSQASTAATIVTSVVLPATTGAGYGWIPVPGLARFNPANGTLTGITLGLEISSYDLTMSLGGYADPGTGAHFVSASLMTQMSATVVAPDGRGLLFASTYYADGITNPTAQATVIGRAGSQVWRDATVRLQANSLFDSFIGTGTLSNMALTVLGTQSPSAVVLDDGTFVAGGTNIGAFNVGPSTMTIKYTFTPTVVPIPAAVWLFATALMGLTGLRRKLA